jgi:hypothetical protein
MPPPLKPGLFTKHKMPCWPESTISVYLHFTPIVVTGRVSIEPSICPFETPAIAKLNKIKLPLTRTDRLYVNIDETRNVSPGTTQFDEYLQ